MFTKRGKVRCEKFCIQQCEAELSQWLPWWEYMTPSMTMVCLCLLSANKALRSFLLTTAALLGKYWLLFVQMCVKEKKQKMGLNKIQELRKRWETVYCNLSFIIFLCIFKVSRRPWEREREEKCCSFKNYATSCVTFSDRKIFECFKGLALGCVLRHCV